MIPYQGRLPILQPKWKGKEVNGLVSAFSCSVAIVLFELERTIMGVRAVEAVVILGATRSLQNGSIVGRKAGELGATRASPFSQKLM